MHPSSCIRAYVCVFVHSVVRQKWPLGREIDARLCALSAYVFCKRAFLIFSVSIDCVCLCLYCCVSSSLTVSLLVCVCVCVCRTKGKSCRWNQQ